MLRAVTNINTVPLQSVVTRSLNTAFQPGGTHGAFVTYSVQMLVTASITGGQDGQCALDIANDQAFTQNVQTVAMSPGSQTYTLAIALLGVQKMSCGIIGWIPAGFWARIRTVNLVGAPVFTYLTGQEVLS